MARAIIFAFFIMAVNLGLMLTNSINQAYYDSTGFSMFGDEVSPYVQYNNLQDSTGTGVNFTSSDSSSNATERALSYGPQSALVTDASFLSMTLNGVVTIVNFLYNGFFGLPGFLVNKFGMPTLFAVPLYIIVGMLQVIGIYELLRGGSL